MQAIKKRLLAIGNRSDAFELAKIFESLFNTQSLVVGSITSGASAVLTTATALGAMVGGVLVAKATGQSVTMTGATVPNSGTPYQAWFLTLDAAGNLTAVPGVHGASLAAVQLPNVPEGQVPVGLITLNNGSAGNYVPGTTNTNTASLTWAFYSIAGPFWPIQVL